MKMRGTMFPRMLRTAYSLRLSNRGHNDLCLVNEKMNASIHLEKKCNPGESSTTYLSLPWNYQRWMHKFQMRKIKTGKIPKWTLCNFCHLNWPLLWSNNKNASAKLNTEKTNLPWLLKMRGDKEKKMKRPTFCELLLRSLTALRERERKRHRSWKATT